MRVEHCETDRALEALAAAERDCVGDALVFAEPEACTEAVGAAPLGVGCGVPPPSMLGVKEGD